MTRSERRRAQMREDPRLIWAWAILLSALGAALGYGIAALLFRGAPPLYLRADPYRGCDLAPEYVLRACALCRPILSEGLLVLLCAGHAARKPLWGGFLLVRALAAGAGLGCALLAGAPDAALLPLAAYLAVTLIWITLICALRTARPAEERLCSTLVAVGAACAVRIAVTLLP